MKSFKQFLHEDMAGNVAGGVGLATYDPIMKFKIFRRKKRVKL